MKDIDNIAPREASGSAARWQTLLRRHDPADATSDPRRAMEIRHAAIEVARLAPRPVSRWPWRLACGALALVLLASGAGDDGRTPDVETAAPAAPPAERRQVQFATPGGTRIIWEINPQFSLREMVP